MSGLSTARYAALIVALLYTVVFSRSNSGDAVMRSISLSSIFVLGVAAGFPFFRPNVSISISTCRLSASISMVSLSRFTRNVRFNTSVSVSQSLANPMWPVRLTSNLFFKWASNSVSSFRAATTTKSSP